MNGLLAQLFSTIDSKKRQLGGLLSDPAETIYQGIRNFGADQQGLLDTQAQAYPWTGTNPQAQPDPRARAELADRGAAQGMGAMFVGKGSKTWDALSAQKAEQMAAQGVDPRKIWKETGTWKGPDGAWRQEIPDNAAMFNTSTVNGNKVSNDLQVGLSGLDLGPTVGGIVDHGRLFNAYGGLTNSTKIGNKNTMLGNGVMGSFDNGTVTLNAPANAKDATSTTLHELQHAIQQREGWARGGSPDDMPGLRQNYLDEKKFLTSTDEYQAANKRMYELLNNPEKYNKEGLPKGDYIKKVTDWFASQPVVKKVEALTPVPADSVKAYRNLAGEAEARATQARIQLGATERRALFPEDSYDVPMNQLIIRGLLGQ